MSRGNIGQQHNSNAPIANKELNIQVVVRIRARSEREVRENSPVAVQTQNKEILVPSTLGDRAPSKSYSFDRVFMYSDQECIYNEVVTPILDEVLTGYNCTIFAYGQTGTGKTFTMEGDLRDNFGECSRDAGIIPRTLYTLFAALERKNTEYTVRVSFLELYNEEVKDLLVPDDDRKVVKIFDSVKKQGPLVQGLEEVPVFNPGQGIDALRKGSAKRTVAATKSNDKSSRSHGVFSITVHVKETADDGEELLKIGKLNLVDLAGSENIARSGAEATQAKEAGRINQSLLTLGRVINSLVERSQHIPYRESKLTRLLEDSLGGKTKTCIIATISPARSCLEETISTLNYANRAKNIKNTPEINQKMSKRTLIKEYLVEIDRLKADLNATREKNGVFMTQESYQTLLDENSSNKDLVGETQKHVDRISQELERVEEKFRENMKLLSATEMKLESKRVELLGIREELEKTKQVLQEETLLRQAHAHTEDQLNSVASGLRSTLAASVKDIRGLHEKLERKNMIERENRRALVEFQERLMALSGELGERIQGFGSNQTGFLDMVTERLDKAFKEATYGAESAQTFLNDQLERMSKAMDNFSALDINTSDRALVFRREFEALRLEITEFLKSRAEISKSNALEGFSGLKAALMEFNGLVDKQQEAMTTRVLGLVDESTKFSRDSISRHQLALDSCQKATSAEIEFLTLQNLTLRQQLKDQEARRDEQKNALLSEIGGLLDSFLRDQTSVVMSHFTGACEALEGSTSRLNTAHSEQRDWVTQFERLGAQRIQELIDTRGAFEKEGVEGRAMIARDGEGMITRSDALRSSIEVDLQSQQEFMQTRMFEMNTKAIGGLEQMQSQQTALAEMFSQTSNHSTTALQDLNTRARTMNMNMTSVYNRTLDDMNAVKGKTQLFSYDASHNLDLAREEMKNLVPHRLKVDDSTGRTPSRRKYTYPQTWSRTRPSQDLLKEFRELGQVKVFTMDQPVGTFDLSESDDSAPVSPSPGQGPDLTDLNLSGSTVAHISPSDADDLRHDTATVNSSEQRLKDSDLLAADIQDESLSGPASRRASLSSTRLEAEKEKENSAKIQSTALGAGNALRPIRPPGKFGLNSITDLGFRRKVGAVQSAPGLSSLLSKRSAPELEDEDAEGNNHTNNLTDISNSIHPTLPNPSQAKTNGATPPPSVATAPSGLTAFGTGKSGMMNSAEGPRKVIRTAHVKPVRRGFPFGGNNKS
ncbi:kinesin motor protein cin8 [Gamsiella multidivaricata]|nr:kinesin motor protein cin8 [Gamsiella multidivaricata]